MEQFNRFDGDGFVVKSPEYWARRSEWIEKSVFKDVEKVNKQLIEGYNSILKDIEGDISEFIATNDLASLSKPVTIKSYLEEMDTYFRKLDSMKRRFDHVSPVTLNKIDQLNVSHRMTRLQVLEKQIQGRLTIHGMETEQTMTEALKDVYLTAYDRKQFVLQRGLGYGYQYNVPNFKAIEKTILYPWAEDGSMFSERIWDYIDNESKNFIKAVRRTIASDIIAQGKNPRTVAKDIVGFGKPSLSASRLKFNATRLLYTEASHILAEAEADVAKEWGIKEYVYLATLDERTSTVCQSLDGEKFEYKNRQVGTNYPPMHPLCRSTIYDVVPNALYTKRSSRSIDGKTIHEIPANVTYKQWQEFQRTGKKPWDVSPKKPERIINSPMDTQDFTELKDYFYKQWEVEVDDSIDNLDFEAVKEGSQGIVDVLNKFPQLKGTLKGLDTSKVGIMSARYDGVLTFNPSSFKKYNIAKKHSSDVGGFHPKNSNIGSTGSHEMGHIIELHLIKKKLVQMGLDADNIIGGTYWSDCTVAKEIVTEATKAVKKQRKDVKIGELIDEISGYAKHNRSETMAEAISDWFTNRDESSDLSKAIMEVTERMMNE